MSKFPGSVFAKVKNLRSAGDLRLGCVTDCGTGLQLLAADRSQFHNKHLVSQCLFLRPTICHLISDHLMQIRDRIKELHRVPAGDLRPEYKKLANSSAGTARCLAPSFAEIGYAGALLARELDDGSLELIDGHLHRKQHPICRFPFWCSIFPARRPISCSLPTIHWATWPALMLNHSTVFSGNTY